MTKPLRQVGVHEAKTHLSELLRAVAGGQEVEILRGGRPVARLVPVGAGGRRELGVDEGKLEIAERFRCSASAGPREQLLRVSSFLLDTQVWLWMLGARDRLRGAVREQLEDAGNDLLLSAASSWEIAIKYRLGKLQLPQPPARYVPDRIRRTGTTPLRCGARTRAAGGGAARSPSRPVRPTARRPSADPAGADHHGGPATGGL